MINDYPHKQFFCGEPRGHPGPELKLKSTTGFEKSGAEVDKKRDGFAPLLLRVGFTMC